MVRGGDDGPVFSRQTCEQRQTRGPGRHFERDTLPRGQAWNVDPFQFDRQSQTLGEPADMVGVGRRRRTANAVVEMSDGNLQFERTGQLVKCME